MSATDVTMAQDAKVKEFPDIGSKLAAPTKKSLFERQKAEAEAKRQREQDETAAVYEDFVKSFDDEGEATPASGGRLNSGSGVASSGGPPRRHFSGASQAFGGRANSGPGSLGPPPPSLSRKRAHDGSQPPRKEPMQGLFAFEDANPAPQDAKSAFQSLDDEDNAASPKPHERAAPKPTMRLSSLPPGTSPAFIKSFLPSNLNIDAIRITPPSASGAANSTERRSLSAIVTLAKETPAIDIDTAVSSLQNKYLGRGFYLSLSRHFSSAAAPSDMPTFGLMSATSSLPFGARPIPTGPGGPMGRAPGSHRGGFAPPQSYAPSGPGPYGRGAPPLQVTVRPPSDLKQLKLIHKTLEALLTHGPEFEALLMSRREVQIDEKWAWLWDSRSIGGVYYRWRLWDVLTGASQKRRGRGRVDLSSQLLFEGGATWAAPEKGLPFEYTTHLEEFVSDSDYNSSDEDDSGDEGRRRHAHYHGGAPPPDVPGAEGDEQAYLNPLEKAKLTHLLARLPTTSAKLRRGDVARVTAFAIQRAGEGAEEVVEMITIHVQKPFAFSGANPDRKAEIEDAAAAKGVDADEDDKKAVEKEDYSASMLIGLYIVSDILSSSSTSGVRHAWRYRQLFETALKQKEIFENLGRLDKTMQWGRLRAEKWKRSVGSVLTLWEGWCVFPQDTQEHFASVFANPPLTAAEEAANAAAEKAVAAAASKSRWKTVEEKAREAENDEAARETAPQADSMEVDIDGEPMDDDENIDGEPMVDEDEDIDGEPMVEAADGTGEEDIRTDGEVPPRFKAVAAGEGTETEPQPDSKPAVGFQIGNLNESSQPKGQLPGGRRRRPRAEDMFADSDDD
ncbi:MAG: hypothetical protein LQ338_005210 [Usnochroma carphineum]|nr:MAG: hypothetical protein LQ338_005210 [Usnochroma carphineum]